MWGGLLGCGLLGLWIGGGEGLVWGFGGGFAGGEREVVAGGDFFKLLAELLTFGGIDHEDEVGEAAQGRHHIGVALPVLA